MAGHGGLSPSTPPPDPAQAAAAWAVFEASTASNGQREALASNQKETAAIGVVKRADDADARTALGSDGALANAWAELRADGARLRAASRSPRKPQSHVSLAPFTPSTPFSVANQVSNRVVDALEPSAVVSSSNAASRSVADVAPTPVRALGSRDSDAPPVLSATDGFAESGDVTGKEGREQVEETDEELLAAYAVHPTPVLTDPFGDLTDPLEMSSSPTPVDAAEATMGAPMSDVGREFSNPGRTAHYSFIPSSDMFISDGAPSGDMVAQLPNASHAKDTFPPEKARAGAPELLVPIATGENTFVPVDGHDTDGVGLEVRRAPEKSSLPLPEQTVPEQPVPEQPVPEQPVPEQPVPEQPSVPLPEIPPVNDGDVEILDLDDPETEAMLEKQAEMIRRRMENEQRGRAEKRLKRPASFQIEDIVVVDSGDDAEDDVIDLVFDPGHDTSGGNVATAGDFFGLHGDIDRYGPSIGAGADVYNSFSTVTQQPREFDKNEVKQLVENNNMSADATEEIDDLHPLTVKLLRHQKRAVAWMIKRETRGADPVFDSGDNAPSSLGGLDMRLDDDDDSEDDNPSTDSNSLAPCLGGILADEQGLGKTLSVIALMVSNPPAPRDAESVASCEAPSAAKSSDGVSSSVREKQRPSWRTLVVCPVSLVGQWKEEIENKIRAEFRPSVYIYHGPKRCRDPAVLSKYDVVITSYTTLSSEYPKVLRGDPMYAILKKAKQPVPRRPGGPLYQCEWFRAILDESHHIKNRRTEGWAAAGQIPAPRRWCLTGTPIQNSVDDIYSLFCFIRYRFLVKNNYKTWNERWKKKLESSHNATRKRTFQQFQAIVGVVTLRRTKLDKIDGKPLISLPERNASVQELHFKAANEQDFYNAVRDNSHTELGRIAASAGGLRENYSGVMLLLLRLRQACCHPYLIEHASSKARQHANGAGDSEFVSPYSVKELDDVQELVESGLSSFSMLSAGAQESFVVKLAPPKPGVGLPPCPDMYTCEICSHSLTCDNLRALAAGNVVCRTCASNILSQHTSGPIEVDPFIDLDDIRKEIHAKVRTARWLAKEKAAKSAKSVTGRSKLSKRPASKKTKREDSEEVPKVETPDEKASDGGLTKTESKEVPEKMKATSTKIMQILGLLTAMRERDSSEKCLIFSQWTSMLDIISYHVSAAGFESCRLDGSMAMLKRKEEVERFRTDDSISVFLISMHAGGTGLNLTEASNVILADCWFNPSVEEQCCDRAHRIGQRRPVKITRFKILDTVEEKIYQMCKNKADTCKAALGEAGATSLGRQKMTLEDALSLFGDQPEASKESADILVDAEAQAAAAEVGRMLSGVDNAASGSVIAAKVPGT